MMNEKISDGFCIRKPFYALMAVINNCVAVMQGYVIYLTYFENNLDKNYLDKIQLFR